jgi:phosphohistidine phosphatase
MPTTRSLFLVRHAIAVERGDKSTDDAERPLKHEGAARMREITKGLDDLGVKLDLILTSPLVRARQTAELLSKGLKGEPEIKPLALLAPGGSPSRIAEALGTLSKSRRIALVGHEPGLGELAAWLIGARAAVPFKKGGVCRIDVDEWPPSRQGQLIWLGTPRMLRR